MRRAYAKFTGIVLALGVVTAMTWSFFVATPIYYYGYMRSAVLCLCMPPRWQPANSEALLAANGWFKINAGRFSLYAPPATMVRQTNSWDGKIITPRFVLTYELGANGFGASGHDVVDEAIRVEGRSAILRRATAPDGSYFAGLFVSQAIVVNGRSVPLLIQGTFRTRGDRAVVDAVLQTVSFKPFLPPNWEHRPPPVKVEPPAFDIAPDPA
jgi:hypothetical protein